LTAGTEDTDVCDEHFLSRYRELSDLEDAAFDALEHACEEGDRASYERDRERWRSAVERRINFLDRQGLLRVGTPA
jgi:hypothetical protein